MLKKLLLPTFVLTLAAFTGVGCHDSSGNGTNKPMPTGGAGSDGGGDGAAGSDGATDLTPSDALDAKATETGGDTATEAGGDTAAHETGGDTATSEGGLDGAVSEVSIDAIVGN